MNVLNITFLRFKETENNYVLVKNKEISRGFTASHGNSKRWISYQRRYKISFYPKSRVSEMYGLAEIQKNIKKI